MNNQEITVFYKWTAKPGKLDELKAIYQEVYKAMKENEPDSLKMECFLAEEAGLIGRLINQLCGFRLTCPDFGENLDLRCNFIVGESSGTRPLQRREECCYVRKKQPFTADGPYRVRGWCTDVIRLYTTGRRELRVAAIRPLTDTEVRQHRRTRRQDAIVRNDVRVAR